MPPSVVEVLPHDRGDALFRLTAFLLEQLGGAVVLDVVDQERVFGGIWAQKIEATKDDRGNLMVRVVK